MSLEITIFHCHFFSIFLKCEKHNYIGTDFICLISTIHFAILQCINNKFRFLFNSINWTDTKILKNTNLENPIHIMCVIFFIGLYTMKKSGYDYVYCSNQSMNDQNIPELFVLLLLESSKI